MSQSLLPLLRDIATAPVRLKGRYSRRSGGTSKTKLFADAVTISGVLIAWCVNEGLLSPETIGKITGYLVSALGLVTTTLRALGPVPDDAVVAKAISKRSIRKTVEDVLSEEKPLP